MPEPRVDGADEEALLARASERLAEPARRREGAPDRLVLDELAPIFLSFYKGTYPTLGHAHIFTAKFTWDTALYWATQRPDGAPPDLLDLRHMMTAIAHRGPEGAAHARLDGARTPEGLGALLLAARIWPEGTQATLEELLRRDDLP